MCALLLGCGTSGASGDPALEELVSPAEAAEAGGPTQPLGLGGFGAPVLLASDGGDPARTQLLGSGGRVNHTATLMPQDSLQRVLVVGGNLDLTTAEVFDPVANDWSPVASVAPTVSAGHLTEPETQQFTGRTMHAAVALQDDPRVLICGGYGVERFQVEPDAAGEGGLAPAAIEPLRSAFVFDPREDTFQPVASLGDARYQHQAVALAGGQVLVSGGIGAGDPGEPGLAGASLNRPEVYDPAGDRWSPLPESEGHHDGGLALPSGGSATLGFGGRLGNPLPSSPGRLGTGSAVLLYEGAGRPRAERLEGGSWLPATSPGADRVFLAAAETGGGQVLVSGGIAPDVTGQPTAFFNLGSLGMVRVSDGTELFDPLTRTWTPGPRLSQARWLHAAAGYGEAGQGGVLVVGGCDGEAPARALASCELFSAQVGAFVGRVDMSFARAGHVATRLADGRVLVSGGLSESAPVSVPGQASAAQTAEVFVPWTEGLVARVAPGHGSSPN